MRDKPQNEPQKKNPTWKELKDASEDLQKVLGCTPAVTIRTQCDDEKLNEWIIDAIQLLRAGDELKPETLKTLKDAYEYQSPTFEEEEMDKDSTWKEAAAFMQKVDAGELVIDEYENLWGSAVEGLTDPDAEDVENNATWEDIQDAYNKLTPEEISEAEEELSHSDSEQLTETKPEPHPNSPLRQHKFKRSKYPTKDADKVTIGGDEAESKLDKPKPTIEEPVKQRPVKDEPSLARIRVSRHKLGRHIARGGGRGGRGRPSSGNIFTS